LAGGGRRTNYYPMRDSRFEELDRGELTFSKLIQRQLPDSTVVKALHNLDYIRLFTDARPSGSPERGALLVVGDDPAAKAEVIRYMVGYDAVVVGTLADNWRQAVRRRLLQRPEGGRGAALVPRGAEHPCSCRPAQGTHRQPCPQPGRRPLHPWLRQRPAPRPDLNPYLRTERKKTPHENKDHRRTPGLRCRTGNHGLQPWLRPRSERT
jgi:hypothetical protein